MIFRQITHDDLGCASYLIGDEDAGVAAVVDPAFAVERYLKLSRYLGVRIEHVFETHNHADHVSGHGRLVAATGASIHIHRDAAAAYDHEAFTDGDEWRLGTLVVRALHTPGHRPEHTAFALIDTSRGPEPWAVLTGDSLFVGDVARPDLAIEPADGARDIFRSLKTRLLTLPENVEVWPAHLGGSMCGGPGMDLKIASTVGYERGHNPTLAIEDEDAFVEDALSQLGPQPPNFKAIVEINTGPLLTDGVDLPKLSPQQLELALAAGALIVDVRAGDQFDENHIPGSVSIPITHAGFGSKLAWLATREQDVIFVGEDEADERTARDLALAVGIRNLGGFLSGGIATWSRERSELARIERISVEDLADRSDEIQILDVREQREWNSGHIAGSVFTPWHDLDDLPAELDPSRPVAVMCASGQRAGTAASLLQRRGLDDVIHVIGGGVPTWEQLGHSLIR
jgi:glyoxylase-like metal-dependent hydrolase (beta-lactamase superfamily II)/rhodanese-related sulfurtransferase